MFLPASAEYKGTSETDVPDALISTHTQHGKSEMLESKNNRKGAGKHKQIP